MIKENVQKILSELPKGVKLVAAAKTRTPDEILEAVEAGIEIVGENYVQEAEAAFKIIGSRIKWHFIGHLQKNKVKKAVRIFDMIETVDSLDIIEAVDKVCAREDRIMSVLLEVNSGREEQKFGILPEDVEAFIGELPGFKHIRVEGLMTMGPMLGDPEDARPYFVETRRIFEKIKKLDMPDIRMKYLSMGMSNSYRVAIEEGANIVRIGSKIFNLHLQRRE